MRETFIFFLALMTLRLYLVSATSTEDPGLKIVGGVDTDIRQTPYLVSVRLLAAEKHRYGSGHICGGTVASQRMITTAAHCIYDKQQRRFRRANEFLLVMGSTKLDRKGYSSLHFYVQNVVIHPHYRGTTMLNDIALFFINGYIPWNSAVRAMALNSRSLPEGVKCHVAGWGSLRFGGSNNNMLQSVWIKLISYRDCAKSYGKLPSSQICAGDWKKDSCQGDSGGPLVCLNALVGIVSYGKECGLANFPGVYTNVAQYRDWIRHMNNSFDYTKYRSGSVDFKSVDVIWLTIFLLTCY